MADPDASQSSPAQSSPSTPIAVAPADTPELKTLVGLVMGVVVVAALYLARDVLVPIMLAVLLSFLLTPLANLLRRLHLGRVPSVLVAVGVALVWNAERETEAAKLAVAVAQRVFPHSAGLPAVAG